jgi:hypothetical protein
LREKFFGEDLDQQKVMASGENGTIKKTAQTIQTLTWLRTCVPKDNSGLGM